jgi:integrase
LAAHRSKRRPERPEKPYREFPLFPHATRRWAKKIRGKLHYFGPWADPDAALQKYLDQKDDLHAGRTPRVQGDGFTVRDLLNQFLTSKRHLLDTRELSPRTFSDYHETCERIGDAFGLTRLVDDLRADDFEQLRAKLAKGWGAVRLGNEVQRIRAVFKYGFDAALMDKPVRFGPAFKRPSRKAIRQARHAKGPRMFDAAELRKVIKVAGVPLRTMFLLGINCGFGNSDIGNLPLSALDLKAGWVNFPRPKTGMPRRCPLWPETIKALREAIARRPEPKLEAGAGLVFITKRGLLWTKETADSPVTKETAKVLHSLGLARPGLNFYALRHTFETVGGETRDQVAVDVLMGHAPDSSDMAALYREKVSDERLMAVTEHVHCWLFGRKRGGKIGAWAGDRTTVRTPAPYRLPPLSSFPKAAEIRHRHHARLSGESG